MRRPKKEIQLYEGKDYELSEGECFRFEKNGLHSVTANGKFRNEFQESWNAVQC